MSNLHEIPAPKKKPAESPPKKKFSSATSLALVLSMNDLIFLDSNKQFYKYKFPVWLALSPDEVQAIICKTLGNLREPKQIKTVFDRLKMERLDTRVSTLAEGIIAFQNGILDLTELCKSSSKQNLSGTESIADFFQPYSSLDPKYVRDLRLMNPLQANFCTEAQSVRFLQYIDSTFESNKELIPVIQEFFGYSLLPKIKFHKWLFMIGSGGNGKTLFLNIISSILGKENVCHMNFAHFNRYSSSNLENKLLNITDELPNKGSDWDSLKNLTGGGLTPAERKFGPSYSFPPTAKFIVSANQMPIVTDDSPAFWDRAIIVPFEKNFRGTNQEIVNYDKVLLEEADGIALWAITGLFRLLRRGKFDLPAACSKLNDEARSSADSVRSFVEERCIIDPRCAEFTDTLHRTYQAYCLASGQKPKGRSNFLRALEKQHGCHLNREPASVSPRKRFIVGIGYQFDLGSQDLNWSRKSKDDLVEWVRARPSEYCHQTIFLSDESKGCKVCIVQCKQSSYLAGESQKFGFILDDRNFNGGIVETF